MDIQVSAAWDGKAYWPLLPTADKSMYKQVDEFKFVMRDSTVLSIAAADAIVSSLPASKEANGARSIRAEERLYPVGYVKEHLVELWRNGEQVKPVTLQTVLELGLQLIQYVHGTADAPGADFLNAAPPSGEKAGAKHTAKV